MAVSATSGDIASQQAVVQENDGHIEHNFN